MGNASRAGEVVSLQSYCIALGLEEGSMRAAADRYGVDHSYMSRLANGENENPSDEFLAKIGLIAERRVVYRIS